MVKALPSGDLDGRGQRSTILRCSAPLGAEFRFAPVSPENLHEIRSVEAAAAKIRSDLRTYPECGYAASVRELKRAEGGSCVPEIADRKN